LVELLKNSMAATIERPNPKCVGQLNCGTDTKDHDDDETTITNSHCPLFVHINKVDTHVVIQIMDQGGGLTHDNNKSNGTTIQNLFHFAQRSQKWDRLDDQQTYAMVRSPMHGLGVGLFMGRLQMRQFGGDVVLEDRPASGLSQVGVVIDHTNELQWVSLEAGMTATITIGKKCKTS
jgi:hypothetical protein